jgi:hypothetical protein
VCDEEMKVVDCAEPMMNLGVGVDCDDVTIPAKLTLPNTYGGVGCDNMGPGYIPDCQNGVPSFVCGRWLPGTVIEPPAMCPYPPSCFE